MKFAPLFSPLLLHAISYGAPLGTPPSCHSFLAKLSGIKSTQSPEEKAAKDWADLTGGNGPIQLQSAFPDAASRVEFLKKVKARGLAVTVTIQSAPGSSFTFTRTGKIAEIEEAAVGAMIRME